MNLEPFRAAVFEVARASVTQDGFSDSLPAKIAALMVRHLGSVDEKVFCETGSAYLFMHGLKVRVSDHRRGERYADVEVRIGKRGNRAGVRFAADQAVAAMTLILQARDKEQAGWAIRKGGRRG